MSERTKFVALLAVTVTLLVYLLLSAVGPSDIAPVIQKATCAEDEACWDCLTMGNQICGPEVTLPETL